MYGEPQCDIIGPRLVPNRYTPVLVIDDERQIRRFIKIGLELQGYTVTSADTGAAGLEAAVHNLPDVIILDLALPDMSGIEVLQSIRGWSNVPVVVLSIESAQETKVLLLQLGADDYIVKPFGIAELAARCDALLRRSYKSPDKDTIVRTGPLAYDLVSRSVTVGDLLIKLTPKELLLLHVMASHLGLVVTLQQLIEETSGGEQGGGGSFSAGVQSVRSLVQGLRRKIELDPSRPMLLMTETGGYRLERLDPNQGSRQESEPFRRAG
jgi:two-component system, OmpR family, KDP operon response regulator KdpE